MSARWLRSHIQNSHGETIVNTGEAKGDFTMTPEETIKEGPANPAEPKAIEDQNIQSSDDKEPCLECIWDSLESSGATTLNSCNHEK